MAHVAKFNKNACGQMLSHYARSKEHIGNKNVDRDKSYLNYNLAPKRDISQSEFIKKRCSEVRCQNRKDVNIMCDWVITIPKDFLEYHFDKENEFFKSTYCFLENKYGKENVVSAYVHKDEVTPHLHFAFIPVVPDKKRFGFKVSAKEAITRADLQHFHEDLRQYLENSLGVQVNVLNEATKEGNKSVKELKNQTAVKILREARCVADDIVSCAKKEAQDIQDNLVAVKAEYDTKKAYIKKADEISKVSDMYTPETKVTEKGLFKKEKFVTVPAKIWEAKHISANEKSCLQKSTKTLETQIEQFHNTSNAQRISNMIVRIQDLKNKNQDLIDINNTLNKKLNEKYNEVNNITERLNKVLNHLPYSVAEQFIEEWETSKKPKNRPFGMER